MITIISGTNRSGAYTRALAGIYSDILQKKGHSCRLLDLRDLPEDFIFSALFENKGVNSKFNEIQEIVDKTAKFVFIIPEYNGSFPGVLKAFIDGLKFPDSFRGKTAGLIGLSSGTMGASLAMSHMTDILNYLGMFVLPIKPRFPSIETAIVDGELKNDFYLQLLEMQADQLINLKCF